jgi:Fe-S cluster assembly ATP-binding protein
MADNIQIEGNTALADKPVEEGLVIKDLRVSVNGREILKGVSLQVRPGEVHALMGENGSGKSTLVNALMGNPNYKITGGTATLNGEDLISLPPDERAKVGLFLGFQYPSAIPGVSVANFVRSALVSLAKPRARSEAELLDEQGRVRTDVPSQQAAGDLNAPTYVGRGGVARANPALREFRKNLRDKLALLNMDESFATRYVNDGFSGGEKKRLEVLQMAMLQPKIAMLDEPDSGLDIDAVRVVAHGINSVRGPQMGILLVTHYQRILNYTSPDFVHVMLNGRIVQSGGPELAKELEERGYKWLRKDFIAEANGDANGSDSEAEEDEHDNA